MRTLKIGLTGDDVLQWQTYLLGKYPDCGIELNSIYDDITASATIRFQNDFSLKADGIAGKNTLSKALSDGMHIKDDAIFETKVSMLTQADKVGLFGTFSYIPQPTKENPEGIKITDNWVYNNIEQFYIPQLLGVKGAPKSGIVYLNKKFGKIVQDFFCEIEFQGKMSLVKSWDGAYYARFVRGSKTYLSNHSYGTAFDINGAWNPLGKTPTMGDGSTYELAIIAEKYNIFWGGLFDRPDPMHFEMGK